MGKVPVKIVCGICSNADVTKFVDSIIIHPRRDSSDWVYTVKCHGAVDRCVVPDSMFDEWEIISARAFTKAKYHTKDITLQSTVKEPEKVMGFLPAPLDYGNMMSTKDIEIGHYYENKLSKRVVELIDRKNDMLSLKYLNVPLIEMSVYEFLRQFKKKTVEVFSKKPDRKESIIRRQKYKNVISQLECEVVMVGENHIYIKYPNSLTPIAIKEEDFFKNWIVMDKQVPLELELKPGSTVINSISEVTLGPVNLKTVEGIQSTSHEYTGPSEWAPLWKDAL